MSVTIEIFKDGSVQADELEARVRELACPRCSIVVYERGSPDSEAQLLAKASAYGIEAFPVVTLDGRVVSSEQLTKGKVKRES